MGVSSSKPYDVKTKFFPEFEESLPSLEGKTICITGCTSGTGYIVARTAARKNAENIFLLNRPSERATDAEKTLKSEDSKSNIETIPCDLQDFESVKSAISSIKSKVESVDVLCANAGVMAMEDVATKDGYDIQMQTNHLSHFLLTKELYPLLKKAVEINGEARICNHSSEARRGKPLEKKYFEKRGGDLGGNGNSMFFNGARWVRYSQTKLANSVFSYSLAQKFEEENVQGMKAVCAHPGLASTQLQITTAQKDGMGWGMWIMRMSQSCEDGAMPIVASCFDKTTENGTFWGPKGVLTGKAVKIDYEAGSKNKESAKVLWEASEEAFGKFDVW